jgi:hypothetical protein
LRRLNTTNNISYMRTIQILRFLLPLLALSACSTDVELEAEWKDIPVVYSFLSLQDDTHYVRVQKAFLEPGGDAFQIAGISDSIYYDENVSVTLNNLTQGTSFVLERVAASAEGIQKEEGLFAGDPHILYKLPVAQANLEGSDEIELRVDRGDELPPARATTTVLSPMDSVPGAPSNRISTWRYTQSQSVAWRSGTEAQIFDIRFIIYYRESSVENPSVFEEKSLEWVVRQAVPRTDPTAARLQIEVRGESFYSFLGSALPPSQGEIRIFDNMDILITGAGAELLEYVRVSQANAGITSSQNIPTYTNVEEGLGVFTSRYELVRRGITLAESARDSLQNGIFTKQLNFR